MPPCTTTALCRKEKVVRAINSHMLPSCVALPWQARRLLHRRTKYTCAEGPPLAMFSRAMAA